MARAIAGVIIIATIDQVNNEKRLLRCKSGDLLTAWLPWPADMGRNYIRHRPLAVGQQVILASHAGDLTQATVIGMLYTSDRVQEELSEDIDVIEYNDGSNIRYDSKNQKYDIIVSGQNVTISKDEIKASLSGSASILINESELKLTHGSSSITLDSTGVKINGTRIELN